MKMGFDAAWDDNPVNVTAEVNMIWSIANRLRGPYQHEKFKDVIIPMTIIRRFECALEPYKKAVVDYAAKHVEAPEQKLFQLSHYKFYNRSPLSLKELCNDADNLAGNFREYIAGFSSRVQEILSSLEFNTQITKMDKGNCLLSVVKAFSEVDLNPKTIDTMKMGYIFEDLIRRFSENAEAGDHYTGRDIIKLMVAIALHGQDDVREPGKVITVCDQASGTGGMLSTAYNFIRHLNPEAEVALYGQEINPESYAMCLAEMMIKGQNADNIRLQDTMKKDCFPKQKMRFVIENPPFGTPWGGKDAKDGVEEAVKEEFQKGKDRSRWGAGLPGSGDMQMLFVQSAFNKLDDNGRMVIVENGSPLFTGGVSSGESQIRRWLLEDDRLEAIIALPTDMFYNTGIASYLWVISKEKEKKRRGKVQLIDATTFCEPLRKSLGMKRNEITPQKRKAVYELYANFKENEFCQIHDCEEFMYREWTVMQPLQRRYAVTEESIRRMLAAGCLSSIYDEAKVAELEAAEELSAKDKKKLQQYRDNLALYTEIKECLTAQVGSGNACLEPGPFLICLEKLFAEWDIKLDKKLIAKIADGLSEMDKRAVIQKDKKGNVIYDKETKDTENVPLTEDVEDYMKREVLPHVPDAHWSCEDSEEKPKVGAEFPFTRFFYKYEKPRESAAVLKEVVALQKEIAAGFAALKGEGA